MQSLLRRCPSRPAPAGPHRPRRPCRRAESPSRRFQRAFSASSRPVRSGVDQQTLRILRCFQQRFDVVVVVFQPEHVQHLRLRHKAGNVGEHRLALRAQRRLQGRLIVYGRVAPLAQQLGARLDGGCRQQLLQPLCRQQPALHGAYAGGQEQIVRVLSPFCQRDAPFQSNSTAATAEESSCRARRSSSAKPQLISMRPRCSTTPPPVSRVSAARVKPAPGFLPLAASTTA